jgi:hypothetical protein
LNSPSSSRQDQPLCSTISRECRLP